MRNIHTRSRIPLRSGCLMVCLLSGCIGLGPDEEHIVVSSIEVNDNEGNGTGSMEVEVHLYDFASDALLGCAGLADVDVGLTRYKTDRRFQLSSPSSDNALRLIDVEEREVYLWVVERDLGECPEPFNNHEDDIIGRSLPFPGVMLAENRDMSFERVVHLRLGAGAIR